MVPAAFQGVAKTMAPAAMAALAVATLAESGDPSVTGIRKAENPSCPSAFPKARARSAAVRSPAQAAWLMPPKPRMYCFWLPSVTVAVCAEASPAAPSSETRPSASARRRRFTFTPVQSTRTIVPTRRRLLKRLDCLRGMFVGAKSVPQLEHAAHVEQRDRIERAVVVTVLPGRDSRRPEFLDEGRAGRRRQAEPQ